MTVQCVFSRISAMEDATVDPEGFMSSLCSSMVNMINRTRYEAMKAKSNFPAQKANTNVLNNMQQDRDAHPPKCLPSDFPAEALLQAASPFLAGAITDSRQRKGPESLPWWTGYTAAGSMNF